MMRKAPGHADPLMMFCGLLCCPCLCSFYGIKAIGSNMQKMRRKRERKRRTINPPKECKTGSVLHEVKEAGQSRRHWPRATRKHWSVQKGCVLLNMPFEIRTIIYQEACGARVGIYIGFSDDGLFGYGDPLDPHAGQAINIVPLMATCRQIYAEVLHFLYSRLQYTVPTALAFFALCGSIPARHFHQLRNIRLDFIQRDGGCETLRSQVHSPVDFSFLHRCGIHNWHNSKVLQLGKNAPNELSASGRKDNAKTQSQRQKTSSFWDQVCVVLSRMDSLQNLHVDMTFLKNFHSELVLEPLEILDKKTLNSLVVEFSTTSDAFVLRKDRWTRVVTDDQNIWQYSEISKHKSSYVLEFGAQGV